MTINKSEIAGLMDTDFGESLRVNGSTFTGVFTLGESTRDAEDEPQGIAQTRKATASWVTGTISPEIDDHIIRMKDDTEWAILNLDPSDDGRTYAELQRWDRVSQGKL